MENIQSYRQPMVTATGILLGFMLDFATAWIPGAFQQNTTREVLVAMGLLLCIPLLVIVLFRILNMRYPKDNAEDYYMKTLLMFILGVTIPFVMVLIVMIENFLSPKNM
jgi:hypothetical protein